MNKIEGMLGIAMRSHKLVSGDKIWDSIRKKQAKLIVIGEDIGANNRKKLLDKCAFYGIEVMMIPSSQMIINAIGANRKAVAICDQGFAKAIKDMKG